MKKSNSKARNCLIILVDCLRSDRCLSNDANLSTMGFLRKHGTTFSDAISSTATTSPSVASILTGFYPIQNGIRSLSGFRLNRDMTTLQEIFRENGYHTYAEVTGPLLPELGLAEGFEEYNHRDDELGVDSAWFEQFVGRFADGGFGSPWFVFVHLFDLHTTMRDEVSRRAGAMTGDPYSNTLLHIDSKLGELVHLLDLEESVVILLSDHGEKLWEGSFGRASYKARLLYRKLKEKMHLRNVRAAPLTGHGFHLYDYLVKIPLLIANTELVPQDARVREQVRQIDVFPTVVDLLDLNCPVRTHGRTLMPHMFGGTQPELPAYLEACGKVLGNQKNWLEGIRTSGFKLIRSPHDPDCADELYDLREDPNERRNLAGHREVLRQELIKEMSRIQAEGERLRLANRLRTLKRALS